MLMHVELNRFDQEAVVGLLVEFGSIFLVALVRTVGDGSTVRALGEKLENRGEPLVLTVTSKVVDDFGDHKGQKHGDQGIHGWIASLQSIHDAKHLNPVEVLAVEHLSMDATAINQKKAWTSSLWPILVNVK
jgi:hypothetical protein